MNNHMFVLFETESVPYLSYYFTNQDIADRLAEFQTGLPNTTRMTLVRAFSSHCPEDIFNIQKKLSSSKRLIKKAGTDRFMIAHPDGSGQHCGKYFQGDLVKLCEDIISEALPEYEDSSVGYDHLMIGYTSPGCTTIEVEVYRTSGHGKLLFNQLSDLCHEDYDIHDMGCYRTKSANDSMKLMKSIESVEGLRPTEFQSRCFSNLVPAACYTYIPQNKPVNRMSVYGLMQKIFKAQTPISSVTNASSSKDVKKPFVTFEVYYDTLKDGEGYVLITKTNSQEGYDHLLTIKTDELSLNEVEAIWEDLVGLYCYSNYDKTGMVVIPSEFRAVVEELGNHFSEKEIVVFNPPSFEKPATKEELVTVYPVGISLTGKEQYWQFMTKEDQEAFHKWSQSKQTFDYAEIMRENDKDHFRSYMIEGEITLRKSVYEKAKKDFPIFNKFIKGDTEMTRLVFKMLLNMGNQ